MSLTLIDKRTGEVTFDGERARRGFPCPVCEHLHRNPSWCLVDKARGLVICPRVASARRCGDAGWLHRMDGGSVTGVEVRAKPKEVPHVDFSDRWYRACKRTTAQDVTDLSKRLGLTEPYVRTVPMGREGRAWVFPMTDGEDVVGLKVRTEDGLKVCAKGSRLGVIVPFSFQPDAPELWVTEGESDLMAAAGALRLNAIARPGCTSCTRIISRMAAGRHLIVLADNDAPGLDGAARLVKACSSAMSATVLAPPAKDVRDWVKRGATAADVRWRLKSRRGW